MKKITAIVVSVCLLMSPLAAQAKTVSKYTTQTVALKNKAKGQTILKVKRNTKLRIVKQGKVWARVAYKGKQYSVKKKYLHSIKATKKYSGAYLRHAGRINWRGYSYTWYSQRVMPGTGLKIPGRHLDKQGFVCDKDGYIVVGSSVANRNKRVIVPTPFGKYGKTYDCGYVGGRHFDCYVNW